MKTKIFCDTQCRPPH